MKKGLVLGALLVALGTGGFFLFGRAGEKAPPYRTAPVERGAVVQSVTATGTLNAVKTVQVGSQVSGTIESILADFNSPVKRGQLIAKIDPRIFEAAVAQSRAGLANAEAARDGAEILVMDAERTLRRNRELIRDGFVAQADVDAAQTAFDTALAQRRSAEAQVLQARGALNDAETKLRYTNILSPVDGIVISRSVDVGQTVAASFQTPTLFTIAQDLTRMQIDTNVDEADIAQVTAGQEVSFTVDAYPERTFKGKVAQVRNAPIVTQNVVTYDAVVRVDNRDLLLKPGMTANVSIEVRRTEDVLKVPNAALRYRPVSPEGSAGRRDASAREGGRDGPGAATVYVVGKKGAPEAVPVRTGISDGTHAQLVAGSLKEGDLLITSETRKANGRNGGGSPPGMGFRRYR